MPKPTTKITENLEHLGPVINGEIRAMRAYGSTEQICNDLFEREIKRLELNRSEWGLAYKVLDSRRRGTVTACVYEKKTEQTAR